MRPFFLNFLADTFKNCEISLPVGKKYILYHYSIIIFPFLTPKIPQNEKMSFFQQAMIFRNFLKVSAKKFKKKGLVVHTLMKVS